MIPSAFKSTIPIDNTPNSNFQMGGRRKKMRGNRGGTNEVVAAAKVGAKVLPMTEIDEEVGVDYSFLDRIPSAKDEDETIRLARIAEEGRGDPGYLTSTLQEEGRVVPRFDVPKTGKGGASRKRKNRTKQKRAKSKKARKGKSKKARRHKH